MNHRLSLPLAVLILSTLAAPPAAPGQEEPADNPTLQSQLEELSAGFAKRAPESMRQTFAKGIEEVRSTGIEEKALNVGDEAVNATLLDPNGEQVQLSSLWQEQPLVITFYRGGWCPYCNLQLRAMQQSLAELDAAGAGLVAITPELPESAQETTRKNALTLTVLTDKGNALAEKMGIAFKLPASILPMYKRGGRLEKHNGDASYTLPLAATYVIDTEGVIRYAFIDADYKRRAEPKEIVAAVKSLK